MDEYISIMRHHTGLPSAVGVGNSSHTNDGSSQKKGFIFIYLFPNTKAPILGD